MIDLILPRRQFLAGLAAALAAPAIVRVDSLMKLPRPKIVRVEPTVLAAPKPLMIFRPGDLVTAGDPLNPTIIGIVQKVTWEHNMETPLRQVIRMQMAQNGHAIVDFDPVCNPTFGLIRW